MIWLILIPVLFPSLFLAVVGMPRAELADAGLPERDEGWFDVPGEGPDA
ncbi:hypothetical protein [Phenylobacterium sp.]|jgi:hypothetical protein